MQIALLATNLSEHWIKIHFVSASMGYGVPVDSQWERSFKILGKPQLS